tara:strand:- start:7 stop:213 length:207 start_codon:yes stop_codon:yes gene_type:complete
MDVIKKGFKVYIKLADFPTVEELAILNDFKLGNYFICEENGYKRLLCSIGQGSTYICMECPINQKFRM